MNYYELLQEHCFTKGISISKLCNDIGLSNATATNWKKGAIPSAKSFKLIADYFNMTIEDLIKTLKAIDIIKGVEEQQEKAETEILSNTQNNNNKNIKAMAKLIQAFACAPEHIKTAIILLLEIDIDPNDITPVIYNK